MKGIELYPYQQELVADFEKVDKILCLWGRITGKTLMAGYLASKYCYDHTGVDVVLVTPILAQGLFLQQFAKYYAEAQPYWCRAKRVLQCLMKRIQRKSHDSRFSIIAAIARACVATNVEVLIIDSCEMVSKPLAELAKLMLAPDGKLVLFSNATYKGHWIHKLFKSKQYHVMRVKTCENPNVDAKFLNNMQKMVGIDLFELNFCTNFIKRPKNLQNNGRPDYLG